MGQKSEIFCKKERIRREQQGTCAEALRGYPQKLERKRHSIRDRYHLLMPYSNKDKVVISMKFDFQYFSSIRDEYPETVSKDQFYRIAHISKSTALYLLESVKVFMQRQLQSDTPFNDNNR